MKTIIHKADSRGSANHGWLKVNHTFSFAGYYNAERIQFGALRVLNDDTIAPEMGFETHPHDNMEIITIPLKGDLKHKDSMGNEGVISEGEIQVMSAGSGIQHSEFNANNDKEINLLQIWVYPNKKNVDPRYDQISIKKLEKENDFFQIASPNESDEGTWIHQEAWFNLGYLTAGTNKEYFFKDINNGVYLFVIEGKLKLGDIELAKRDGVGISETSKFNLDILENSRILIMEVPMKTN